MEVWDTGHLGTRDQAEGSTGRDGAVEEGIPTSFMSIRARELVRRGDQVSTKRRS